MTKANSLGFVVAKPRRDLEVTVTPFVDPPPRDWEVYTARVSVAAQLLFGLFSLAGFFVRTTPEHRILVALLVLDTAVQAIELTFYALFLYYNKLPLVYRYVDWFFSTPTMLVSLFVFLRFLGRDETLRFGDVVRRDLSPIVWMLVLNAAMLLGG